MILYYPEINSDLLLSKLRRAVLEEANKHTFSEYPSFTLSENHCKIDNCSRASVVKGMCNAHYIRHRKGMDMSIPVENRKNPENCLGCGAKTDSKSGWGRCTRCYKNDRRSLLKTICVEHLGGKCNSCKNIYPNRAMDFHYIHDKQQMVSYVLMNMSLEGIAHEVSKCILLCANCSREMVYIKRGTKLDNLEVKIIDNTEGLNLDDKSKFIKLVKDSLLYQVSKYSLQGQSVSDKRNYLCFVEGCDRNGYAKGMCNTHYIRSRKGKDLTYPNKSKRENFLCIECYSDINKNTGGWQRCSTCYNVARYRIMKEVSIYFFENKCKNCEGVYKSNIYDFHHSEGKDFSPAVVMRSRTVDVIASEILRCELLCANCHRIEHIRND